MLLLLLMLLLFVCYIWSNMWLEDVETHGMSLKQICTLCTPSHASSFGTIP
jgi:hypothetical protein